MRADEIARLVGGELEGDPTVEVLDGAPSETAGPIDLGFVEPGREAEIEASAGTDQDRFLAFAVGELELAGRRARVLGENPPQLATSSNEAPAVQRLHEVACPLQLVLGQEPLEKHARCIGEVQLGQPDVNLLDSQLGAKKRIDPVLS